MRSNLHLVCLREPNQKVSEAIRELYGDRLYEIADTQYVVQQAPNGGKSVYQRLKERVDDVFVAFVVQFDRYHGRHQTALWDWLEADGEAS